MKSQSGLVCAVRRRERERIRRVTGRRGRRDRVTGRRKRERITGRRDSFYAAWTSSRKLLTIELLDFPA